VTGYIQCVPTVTGYIHYTVCTYSDWLYTVCTDYIQCVQAIYSVYWLDTVTSCVQSPALPTVIAPV